MNAFDRFFPSSTVIFIGGLVSCGLLTFVCWNAVQIEDQKKALLFKEQKLDEDRTSFETKVALYPYIKEELPKLKVKYDTAMAELNALLHRHEEKEKEFVALKEQLKNTHETFNSVALQLDKSRKQLANTKEEVEKQESSKSSLADEVARLEREKSRLERQVGPLNSKVQKIEADLKALESEQTDSQDRVNKLKKELASLEGKLSAKNDALKALSEEDGKLTLIVEQTRPLLEQLAKANSTANELLVDLRKETEGIAKSGNEFGIQLAEFKQTVDQAKTQTATMTEIEKKLRPESERVGQSLNVLNQAAEKVEQAAQAIISKQEKTLTVIEAQATPLLNNLSKAQTASEELISELAVKSKGIAESEKTLGTQVAEFTQIVVSAKSQSSLLEKTGKDFSATVSKADQALTALNNASVNVDMAASAVSAKNEKVMLALDNAAEDIGAAAQSITAKASEINKAQTAAKNAAERLQKTTETFTGLAVQMEASRKNLTAGFQTLEQLQKKLQASLTRLENRQGLKIASDLEKALNDVVSAAEQLKVQSSSMTEHSAEFVKLLTTQENASRVEDNTPSSEAVQ